MNCCTSLNLLTEDPSGNVRQWFENKEIGFNFRSIRDLKTHQIHLKLFDNAGSPDGDDQPMTAIHFTNESNQEHQLWARTSDIAEFIKSIETFVGEKKLAGETIEEQLLQASGLINHLNTFDKNLKVRKAELKHIADETGIPLNKLIYLYFQQNNFWSEGVDKVRLVLDFISKETQIFEVRGCKIPTEKNRIANITHNNPVKQAETVEHFKKTRPIIHARTMELIKDFLDERRLNGSPIEKALYENMEAHGLVDRCLSKRPLSFVGGGDSHTLEGGRCGEVRFETIGTVKEQPPLVLKDLMSYLEMMISALIGVSVPTHFINAGDRGNRSKIGYPGTFEEKGIYVGMVGARFERKNQMEWRHMMITKEQNTIENGYGLDADEKKLNAQLLKPWAKLYRQTHFPTYDEAEIDTTGKYFKIHQGYFNKEVYKERMKLVITPYLHDANQRAQEQGKQAYVHCVGLGLGVWQITQEQAKIQLEAYAEVLAEMELPNIADIDFSWFSENSCGGLGNGEYFDNGTNHIKIHFSRRDPAAKLKGEDEGKLVVAMYAWDSNSFPGNEYWGGALTASGDPAAACCSTIPQLQNPRINPNVSSRRLFVAPETVGE